MGKTKVLKELKLTAHAICFLGVKKLPALWKRGLFAWASLDWSQNLSARQLLNNLHRVSSEDLTASRKPKVASQSPCLLYAVRFWCPQTKCGFCLAWLTAFLQAPYQQLIPAHLTQRELRSQETFHVHSTYTCFRVYIMERVLHTQCTSEYSSPSNHMKIPKTSKQWCTNSISNHWAISSSQGNTSRSYRPLKVEAIA